MIERIRQSIVSSGILSELSIDCMSEAAGYASISETGRDRIARYVDGESLNRIGFSVSVCLAYDSTPEQGRRNYAYMTELAKDIAGLCDRIGAERLEAREICRLIRSGGSFAVYRAEFEVVCTDALLDT